MARLAPLLRPALVVLVVLALLVALVWLAQRRLIYLPDRSAVPSVTTYFPEGEDVTLHTSDGWRLGAWYVPPAASGPKRDLTVLVAPGNGGNREGRVPLARGLAEAGFAVLLFDYRGYGGNPGRPTEAGLARDVRAALRYLVDERDDLVDERDDPVDERANPLRRILYFGESLGAGVVTELATDSPPAGMLLRSPFTDLAAAGATHYPFLPVRLMLWDRFPVADNVAQVSVPIAVVYGSEDSIVPPEQSREVASAVSEAQRSEPSGQAAGALEGQHAVGPVEVTEIAGADHNDPALSAGPELVAAVVRLAQRAKSPR